MSGEFFLDPEVTFLNHGSFGAVPRPVFERRTELLREMEREPVAFFEAIECKLDPVRERLGALVGAKPDGIAFVPNATSAVNAVLRSFPFQPGDELVVGDQEYQACRNALDYVAEKRGARAVVVEMPFPLSSPDEIVERFAAARTERTRLALLDHVTSPTGLVLPIERIVRRFEDAGVPVLVDGAHAVGMVPLDLDALGASYYTSNCHKWLCAPKGAAFLYVREDRRASVRPVVISHGAGVTWRPDRSRYLLEFDWPGTWDPTPALCIPASIDFLEGALPGGLRAVMEHNRALALEARGILTKTLGIEAPAPESMIGSLAAVPLPPGDAQALHVRLVNQYRVQVPVSAWPSHPSRVLRVSAQIYNRREHYERLATVLPEAMASGA